MLWVIYICDRSAKYGIGGKAAVFLANIYDGIFHMIAGKSWDEVKLPLLVGIIEAALMIFFDNTEKRIPTLRVSIHSIYADKNYLAYKFIPVGVMPLMFCSAIFALVQIVMGLLAGYFPDNGNILWASSNMAMTRPLGMIVYIGIIWLINIVFAFITLSPIKTADNFKKSGDSMENIYAGKKSTLYLVGCVARLSAYSSIIFSVFAGIPFLMYLYGFFDSTLMLLPTSMMMTTGLWLMLYRESEVYIHYDRYKAFI